MVSHHGPCIRECLCFPPSEKTHLTSALTNCPARRETLHHCSLGRSMCWQHSSGTSQRTGAGETHQLQLQSPFLKVKVYFFWRMADGDFPAVFSAPEIPQSIHLKLAFPAVSSSRVVFEKSVLGSSSYTAHQWMQGDQHLPFSNTMFRNTTNKFLKDSPHSWLSKHHLPPTIPCASLLPASGFLPHPQHSG